VIDFTPILALADMSRVPYAIVVLLVVGIAILRRVRPAAAGSPSRIWLPIAAFIAGPSVAFLYFRLFRRICG